MFNNGSLEEIAGIHLYTSDEVSVDCSKGLPSSVKHLKFFNTVFGKYNTTPEDKLKLDLLYINQQSVFLDLKLILYTVKIMFVPESTEGFEEDETTLEDIKK